MLHRTYQARTRRHAWLWALLPLLLAAGLTVTALGRDVFDIDEAATMLGAGARHIGPFTPAEAVAASVARSPDQAWGQVVVYSLWGRVAGWSELAIRALPWLTGLLTLAWVYRFGRALFTERIALMATLLLATSVLFLTYMHVARSFTFAMLFAAIVLWAYWRVALHRHPPGHGARAALVLGATGLLYAHYFSALLLPALALFHLFFVRKERRWWQPVALLGLAALLALPQAPSLLGGIQHNQVKEELHDRALSYAEVISLLLRHLSDGLLEIRRPFSTLLALTLPLPLLIAGWRSRRSRQTPGAVWYLALTCTLLLLLLLVANEWLQVLEPTRVRYLATLWPPAVLLISLALLHPKRALLRPPGGLVLVALMAFIGTSDYLGDGVLASSWYWRDVPFPIAAMRMITPEESTSGFLVMDRDLSGGGRVNELYTGAYEKRQMWLYSYTTSDTLFRRAQEFDLVWLMLRSSLLGSPQEDFLNVHAHLERFRQEGWFHCRSWRDSGVALELLLAPLSTARGRLQFESAATLFAPDEPQLLDGRLRLRTGLRSEDYSFLDRHSLAIHIIDSRSGERVAQADTGVGPGNYVPLCREIDVSALPPGDYEVRVALYDWQTGERLSAHDLETDEVGDMHTLYRFRSG